MIDIIEEDIIKKWKTKYDNKPQVSITCLAYNHESFIENCLDSLLSQNVDFPYEIIIHDDASTDRTTEIIKKYEVLFPNIIKPIYQIENQYSKKNGAIGRAISSAVLGKYRALCECDDFWIDNDKLQRQFDYLEENSNCVACCSGGIIVDQYGNDTGGRFALFNESKILPIEVILSQWIAPTASIIYRWSLSDYLAFSNLKNRPCGDYPLLCGLALLGDIYYDERKTCAYRDNPNSVTHDNSVDAFYMRKKSLLLMLGEMNRLTNFQYEACFSKMADAQKSSYYLKTSNAKMLRKTLPVLYGKLNTRDKIKLWIKYVLRYRVVIKQSTFENFDWRVIGEQ